MRTAAGAYEIAQYARYEVTGPDAEAWLDRLLAGVMPSGRRDPARPDAQRRGTADGRPHGRASRRRSVLAHRLPTTCRSGTCAGSARSCRRAASTLTNITDACMGFSVSGPASRAILGRARRRRRLERGVRRSSRRSMRRRPARAVVGRISLTGELGYEIVVPANRAPSRSARAARGRHGAAACGSSVTVRSTACGWRRATASGRRSSDRTTRRP